MYNNINAVDSIIFIFKFYGVEFDYKQFYKLLLDASCVV